MKFPASPRLLLLALALFALPLMAQHPALTDDPEPDKNYPAAMETFQLPSHGALLNALVYLAPGKGPHPTVILLHGFPGNEKNLDLAQAIRRDGWNVLYFDYRGSWGSPGNFSFSNCIEDVASAIAWLRTPANAARLRSDPAHIVLVGHSMGGFLAIHGAANDPGVEGLIVISAADMAGSDRLTKIPADKRENFTFVRDAIAKSLEGEGMAPLAGTSGLALATELLAHSEWAFSNLPSKLVGRPFLAITSDDGLTQPVDALVDMLKKSGSAARSFHYSTDHSYSDHRIALTNAVITQLDTIEKR